MKKRHILGLTALSFMLWASTALAGNVNKKYINVSKETAVATKADLGNLATQYGTAADFINKNSFDSVSGFAAINKGNVTKSTEGTNFSGGYVETSPDGLNVQDFTITFWMKSSGGRNSRIFSYSESAGSLGGFFVGEYSDGRMRAYWDTIDAGGTTPHWHSVFSTSKTNNNQWHHVAVTHLGKVARIYIDGLEEGAYSDNVGYRFPAGNYVFRLGTWINNTSEPYNGTLKEATFWKKALSLAEIRQVKDGQFKLDDQSLLRYWKLN